MSSRATTRDLFYTHTQLLFKKSRIKCEMAIKTINTGIFNRYDTDCESQISFSSLEFGVIRPKEYHVSVKIRTYFSVRKITDLIILQNFAQYNVFLNIFKTENFSKQTIFYRKNSFIKNKLCNF